MGGGVIGLACALYLLKAGASVRVLEQGLPGNGASHGNCGTITPSHAGPLTMPGMIGTALRSLLRRDAPLLQNIDCWCRGGRFGIYLLALWFAVPTGLRFKRLRGRWRFQQQRVLTGLMREAT